MPRKYTLNRDVFPNTQQTDMGKFGYDNRCQEDQKDSSPRVFPSAQQTDIVAGDVQPKPDADNATSYQLNPDPFPLASIELEQFNSSQQVYEEQQEEEEEEEEEEDEDARKWRGRFDFVVAVLGYNIGLGSLLRFPYLCMKNGGGAFLIPYFIFLVLLAIPLYMIEMAVGQYSGLTPIQLFGNIAPLFKGIGWCNVLTCGILNIYYSVVLGWILFYLVNSFYVPLLWSSCKNAWKSADCYEANRSAPRPTFVTNCTIYSLLEHGKKTVTETFYENYLLEISDGIDSWGSVRWQLFLTLLATWVIVYLCVFRGMHMYGRVVYVTVLMPYLALIILLVRGVMLPGSREGILYYLTPDWPRLATPTPWVEAAQQIFWSLGPTWGALVMLSSHNKFSNNIYRDAIVTPVICAMTSFLGGFVVFSYLGNMAWKLNTGLSCIFKSGPTMAFIVYPDAVLNLPFPQIWSILFFVLLLMLGVDSELCTFETMYQCLADEFRILKKREWLSKLIMAIVSLLLGLPMTTNAAHYIYQLLDWYHTTLLAFVALIEVICLAYVYGSQQIRQNVETMTGIKMTFLWDIYWRIPLLAILTGLLIMTIVTYSPPTYGTYVYPIGAIAFGWCLTASVLLPLPVVAVYRTVRQATCPEVKHDSKKEALKTLVMQTEVWHLRVKINSDGLVG